MEPPELREDLKQEIFVIVCEMEEQKLLELFASGNMRFFIVRTIINQIQSSNSPFYYKYRKMQFAPLVDIEIIDHTDYHIKEEKINHCQTTLEAMKIKSSSDNYNAIILEKYIQYGSLRALSSAMESVNVKIPFTSLAHTVNKAKSEIKKSYVI